LPGYSEHCRTRLAWVNLSGRFFVCTAMNRPEAQDQIARPDADDASSRKKLAEDPERACVVRVVERWNENEIVCHVVVRVARRQAFALPHHALRKRDAD